MDRDRLEIIERCTTPRGEIQLQRRGTEYEIINGTFLMATYNGGSEKLLVQKALEASGISNCSVLIGGLGVGYSLAEALDSACVRQVTVIEIEEKIIEWNRTHLSSFSGHAVNHPKTKIVHADINQWISQTDEKFDVICLDVDNGPDWTVFEGNTFLYDNAGLAILSRLLNPGGVISFWSASSSPSFMLRLKNYFTVIQELAIEHQQNIEPDYIYIAKNAVEKRI